ncbi:unnamed protein product [Caenorhabditis nigoni]
MLKTNQRSIKDIEETTEETMDTRITMDTKAAEDVGKDFRETTEEAEEDVEGIKCLMPAMMSNPWRKLEEAYEEEYGVKITEKMESYPPVVETSEPTSWSDI